MGSQKKNFGRVGSCRRTPPPPPPPPPPPLLSDFFRTAWPAHFQNCSAAAEGKKNRPITDHGLMYSMKCNNLPKRLEAFQHFAIYKTIIIIIIDLQVF